MSWRSIIIATCIVTFSVGYKTEEKLQAPIALPTDLQEVLDTLYNSGYIPEYVQEELSESEKSNADYLEFPDFNNNSQNNAESLNHPSWMSYQKEVFVPPESEYKNIISQHNEKSHQKLSPFSPHKHVETLWNQFWKRPNLNPQDLRAELLAPLTDTFDGNLTGNASAGVLDFLHPIPEKGRVPENLAQPTRPPTYQIPPQQNQIIKYSPPQESMQYIMTAVTTNNPQNIQVNRIQNAENQSNDIAAKSQLKINENNSSLFNMNNGKQVYRLSQIESSRKSKLDPGDLKSGNTMQIQEVQVSETQRAKEPNEQTKKINTSKKKIFSFLNVFKKGPKFNSNKALNNSSTSTAAKAIKKENPTTLRELYDQLIEARNLYERNNLYQNNEPEQQSNLISEQNVFPQNENEIMYEQDLQDLGRNILNEAKIRIPQILYQKKKKK